MVGRKLIIHMEHQYKMQKINLVMTLYYIKNFSNLLDIRILFMTIKLVFNAKGAIANK